MFDRTQVNVRESPRYPQHIHEHRAPTDSIRLLNEMREKALTNIIANIPVELNALNATIIRYRDPEALWDEIVGIKFNLNGQEFTFKHRIHAWKHKELEQCVEELREDFSRFLASTLLGNMDLRPMFRSL